MKTPHFRSLLSTAFAVLAFAMVGCSSAEKVTDPAAPEFAKEGPTILNVSSQPGIIELNENFRSDTPVYITADIKDFNHDVTDVRLRFRDVPLEIPMVRMGGTTWRAELGVNQLQQLAISGKTVRYSADVLAWNSEGEGAQTDQPLTLSVRGPDLATGATG